MRNNVITEITPLSDKDCFYLVDRHKTIFDYPIHRHQEFELNFVSNCTGARRIVGDSIETLAEYDLVLIGGGLEHSWQQGDCNTDDKREITIQFSSSLISKELLAKNQMKTISDLFDKCSRGVVFGMDTIMAIYGRLDELTKAENPPFIRLVRFLEILYHLSISDSQRVLSTSSFANTTINNESRRVSKVEEEIRNNYRKQLSLQHLAHIAGMTPTAFSRFFRQRTGRTLSEYIVDIRLGHAARMLVDTSMSISEICYDCGFNNISNFNRAFKRTKGCSPKTFRDNYLKTKVLV